MTSFDPSSRGPLVPVWNGGLGSWTLSVQRCPLSSGELSGRYAQIATSWDRLLARLGVQTCYASMIACALKRMDHLGKGAANLAVLDSGAGTGALSRAFADNWEGPLHIDMVDVSAEMLAKAEVAMQGSRASHASHVADIRALPQSSVSQDIVLCAHAVEHLPQPDQALSEFYRVLRPGGWLMISLTPPSLFGWMVHLRWRARLFRMGEAVRYLANHGFEAIQHIETTCGPFGLEQRFVLMARKPLTPYVSHQGDTA